MHWDELLKLCKHWIISEETVRILRNHGVIYMFSLSETSAFQLIKIYALLFITFLVLDIVLTGWGA